MSDNKSLSPYQIIQAAQKTAGRAPADTPDKNRLVDIMVFDLMVAVFTAAIEQEVVTFDAKDIQGVQATMEKIARRYMPVAEVNYDAYLAPLSEMPGGQRLSMSYARVNRSPMPLDRAVARGIFCAQALRFMRTKPETLKTFARKATPVLRDLMQVANEDNPFKAASVLAEQPTISGVGAIRRWVIEAAELMLNNVGALSSDSASFVLSKEEFDAGVLTGDVASAQNLAENIRSIERKKDLTDPMSEQAQELEVELLEVQEELKEMAQASKDQTLVETAISTTIADRDVPPSLRSMGLSEDQLAVALASGQVLVNAGAGSGKSFSLVAHVMHQVTENGVNPDAILLTSFTKASAMELKERLEKKGITGRSLGRTSHSIAYGIIMQYGSRGLQEMLRQSGSNKPSACADMAFKQLFMKPYTDDEFNNSRNVQDLARQQFTPFKKVSLAWADSRFAEMVNLGAKYAEENEGAKLDKGRLLLKVGEFKNARVKPDQAWDIYGSGKYGETNKVAAAFYVMYEWLKTADPQYGQCLDFDDQLVTAVEILEQNPRARAATQAQYDVVLIDEAQDFSQIQSQLFSLISEKASTVMYVGDDRQCVARDSLVTLQGKGEVPLSEACVGDKILAYRKGKAVFQTISVLKPSSWTEGYRVTTVSGHQLSMSPNHKIWADTRPVLKEDETLVYLMHKERLGYRVGQTKGKWQKTGVFGRAQDEGAESMWLLAKTPNLEDALFQENMLSLRYGIPTAVFNGTKRSLNQERIQSLFDLFGQNGQNLLTDRNLDSTLPHWMKGSYSKHGRTSKTVYFDVQASTGCLIHCEAEGEGLKALSDAGFDLTPSKRGMRFRKLCKDYHTGYKLAKSICDVWGAKLLERLCVGKERLPLINAAALLEGMSIPVLQNGETVLEEIVRIERLEGLPQGHYLDLQVDDSANFFANGILSHNSIYEWRGASPQEFIQRAKNEDVQVLSLQINYRSGSDIVEAGEQLIKYNTDQLPKSCRAPINRGPGQISYRHKGTSENVAGVTADEIKTLIDSGEAKPDSFGVITRTNAEKAAYMWTLAFRGIPYRSNSGTDIFKKPYLKAASAALLIASPNTPTNQRNDALVELHDQMSIGTPKIFREMDFRRKTDFVDALLNDPKPYYKARAFQAKVETLRQIVRDLLAMGQNPEVDSREIIEKVLYTPGHDEDPETGARLSIYDKMRGDAVSELVESNIDDGADKKEAEDLASGSSADMQVMTELEPLFLLADMKPNASSLADYLRKQKEVNANKDSNEPAVQIDTCHQWKGLAAEHIYVHMAGGSWPSRFAEAVEEKMEGDPTKREGFKRNPMFEERRLAYVAITRGKETVTINAPAVDSKGKGIPLSRFVGEACIPAQGQVELSEEDVQERQGNIKSAENHFKVILAEALYGTTTD